RTKLLLVTMSILAVAVAGVWLWLQRPQPPSGLHLQTIVRTEPSGALVVLGDHAEKSPATFQDLEPRKYNLRIMAPGFDPIETVVDLSARRAPVLQPFHLIRSKGSLEIQSEPPGAQFSIRSADGQISRDGTTPQSIIDLPTGKYSIVAHRGDWETRDEVEVQRGQKASKTFAFVSSTATVTSEPNGAEISVDGKSSGHTPLRLELPARSHELTAHLEGWPNEQQKIEIERGRENAAHFVFANGSVKITSAPGGATVLANGKDHRQGGAATAGISRGAIGEERRSRARTTVHEFAGNEICADGRYSNFNLGNARWRLRRICPSNRPALRADGFSTGAESSHR